MVEQLRQCLREQVAYIEGHVPGLIIVSATLYGRRHIFEGDDGKLYLLKKSAGWDIFTSMLDAMNAITRKPNTYPITPSTRRWADEAAEEYYGRRNK